PSRTQAHGNPRVTEASPQPSAFLPRPRSGGEPPPVGRGREPPACPHVHGSPPAAVAFEPILCPCPAIQLMPWPTSRPRPAPSPTPSTTTASCATSASTSSPTSSPSSATA